MKECGDTHHRSQEHHHTCPQVAKAMTLAASPLPFPSTLKHVAHCSSSPVRSITFHAPAFSEMPLSPRESCCSVSASRKWPPRKWPPSVSIYIVPSQQYRTEVRYYAIFFGQVG
ncbi:hypothetical protein BDY21DRAFT_157097 [Lineolata rhizophorae]|uniref:Uncharacterized protein n=1 Tax=Lineolata rhizophorae TaxID=578093 RepID=A0A6A6NM34_9PEZI|nr:hypothetical protein BDY21DRAFT_157097 [Lineolata rhizophorae]